MTSAYGSYFPDGTRRHYYRCFTKCPARGNRATSGTFVPVLEVEAEVSKLIVDRLEELRVQIADGDDVNDEPEAGGVTARLEKLNRRRERYLETHADGLITLAELREKLHRLDDDRLKLEAQVSRVKPLSSPQERRGALREIGIMAKAWKRAPSPLRREIAKYLMSECAMAKGSVAEPRWRPIHELVTLPDFSGR